MSRQGGTHMTRKLALLAALVLALAALSAGVAIAAGGGGDDDKPLTGPTLDKATAAAREHAGGGTVVETEAGDDGAAYGVELRLDDGRQIEVSLDENFNVIGREADDGGANDNDDGADDD
jgi:uncharacterized membrane protein YkoI